MIFDNKLINEAYNKIQEADVLKRTPAKTITHGRDEFGEPYGNGETLDDRINLRGKAENLRGYETDKASHLANIVNFWDKNKDMLISLRDDLEKEMDNRSGMYELALDLQHFISKLEDAAIDADEELSEIRNAVKQPYHIGQRGGNGLPNDVEH